MKNKLRSILFGIGVLVFIFSGCQKQSQLAPDSAISTQANQSIGHTFDATFTKWLVNFPNMAGVVGGDVGTGTYAGEILNISSVGDITSIEALYHFNGRIHSFTAHVFISWNTALGPGVITGSISEGWLKDGTVTGGFDTKNVCPIPTPGNSNGTECYEGVLHISVPKDDSH